MPLTFIEPMQPTLVDEPPAGGDWVHEVKWDGYRTQIVKDGDIVCVFTRRGHDWTLRYSHIAAEASNLPCQSAIIDGEVILADPAGASDFAGLQAVIASNPAQLTYVVFDLLHLDGKDLRRQTLAARREALQNLTGGPHGDRIQSSLYPAPGLRSSRSSSVPAWKASSPSVQMRPTSPVAADTG